MNSLEQLVQTIVSTASARGISQSELARRAGVARETVSRLPGRKDADFNVLQKLGAVLDLNIVAVERKVREKSRPVLSFPYDWSNSKMETEKLITAVLNRAIFSDVLAVARHYGLFAMKSYAIHRRTRSRDLVDLWYFTRTGKTLGGLLAAGLAASPSCGEEYAKQVLRGDVPLDAQDEGFEALAPGVTLKKIYRAFAAQVDALEIDRAAQAVRR